MYGCHAITDYYAYFPQTLATYSFRNLHNSIRERKTLAALQATKYTAARKTKRQSTSHSTQSREGNRREMMEENIKWGNDRGKYRREEESRWSCNE